MKRLRKGDQVEVICGKDRGRKGTINAMVGEDRALVDGINVVKRHTRPNPQENNPGGVIDKIKSIHVSNLMLVNPQSGQAERVSIRVTTEGDQVKRQRYFKSNQAVI